MSARRKPIFSRPAIEDVFTPRMADVNPLMYISRPKLESSLTDALDGSMHALLFGDSGNGKSWLYKKVMADMKIPYVVANCGNAARLKSVTEEIVNALVDPATATKTDYEESKSAKGSVVVLEAEVGHTGSYAIQGKERLFFAFESYGKKRKKRAIVVLDNLERIFSTKKLMSELGNILILQDDPRYAQWNISFLLVGVPDDVIGYFSETEDLPSVANRIYEVDRVRGLSDKQVLSLVSRGLKALRVTLQTFDNQKIGAHVYNVTLGIPQRVHEYCKCLAREIKQCKWRYTPDLLFLADDRWLRQGFRKSLTVLNQNLNSRDTKVARRNQVMYAISKTNRMYFDVSAVDSWVRKEFPLSIPKSGALPISQTLKRLCMGRNPFLVRVKGGSEYSVKDPRHIMTARMMLYKDENGSVKKVSLVR